MSKSYTLKAEVRERVGKGSSRELRRNGLIPAVIYGDKQPPLAISVPYKEVFYKIHGGGFRTTIATLEIGKEKIQVLPKDYQLDPVRDFPMHVDFLRVSAKSIVHVNIPVHFLNEDTAPGIKRGGVLNIVRHEIECTAPANAIPDAIQIDLSSYSIGDSIHISAVQLPEGVTPVIQDRNFTIATIAAPAGMGDTSEEENNESDAKK
ncbi:50S ribosomal protein L25 [Bartonella bacilliformis Peru38]|uniref:50S ribosomal protein L25/general stress protein Ctc n=1 Tax=Bartonella bacilliformis TaxID=774 RepID=UPI000452B04A|nr:50S ribosomal protein L25/general stress protein Ctc [Bartonella bacilliformis]EYS94704.1 50S ribosomal protein L25 [Bartonella bacilliformis Peru-18]KEG16305.1 50S ribosomal protein L25 [Bartonella bacilliformis CUSCO5]KEG20253.1 50S ribosomal protein L25 [Bartonella bacilliformis Peru38]KEG23035.1 50S ribosomal protein L25 [Bartonella bacilliformis Ver075]KZM37686.1 50S ribosomal protein L25/general stress protein Ctc [Bartonella bacilliformis]